MPGYTVTVTPPSGHTHEPTRRQTVHTPDAATVEIAKAVLAIREGGWIEDFEVVEAIRDALLIDRERGGEVQVPDGSTITVERVAS